MDRPADSRDTASVSGYCLGRSAVPVDVCRPRRPISAPLQASDAKVLVHRDTPRYGSAVPRPIAHASDTTQPFAAQVPSGPGHAQLHALAATGRGELVLAGRYRLDRSVGRGGMATVFAGEQIALGRPVAIKILDDERGLHHGGLQRFMREAQMLARLGHANVVEVFDLGSTPEGVVYMVMELLEGEDLRALLAREGRLPWARVRERMLEICAGLEAVHAAGFVHRDVKPANCFATADGIKLLDFGIAATPRELGVASPMLRDDRRLTLDGQIIGTPEYMSPEQARGASVDARSDVYSAGIVLGELLTGRVPFVAKTAAAVIDAQIHSPAPTLRELGGGELDVDPDVEAIYARALSKQPDQRFASVAQLRAAIEAVGANTPRRRRWYESWRAVAAAGLAISPLVG